MTIKRTGLVNVDGDEIINHGKLDMFNDSNFTKVVMYANPNIIGIDSARAYYANYLTGFSNIKFTIIDVFGQGNKLVKHWNLRYPYRCVTPERLIHNEIEDVRKVSDALC